MKNTNTVKQNSKKKEYYMFLIGIFLSSGGCVWIIEHWLTWGYLEFELIGHETAGLACVLAGVVLMVKHVYYLLFEKNNKE